MKKNHKMSVCLSSYNPQKELWGCYPLFLATEKHGKVNNGLVDAPSYLAAGMSIRVSIDNERRILVAYGLGTLPENPENLMVEFANNVCAVYDWFYKNPSLNEVLKMYAEIQTVWLDRPKIFRCKGIYKTVRRLFIKNVARWLNGHPELREELPVDLCWEILCKQQQNWIAWDELDWQCRANLRLRISEFV